ncbi:WecB/TagA/CpsF family glycosyltransferase [Uliginosibacterium sp. H1]|uniref:WecB/TagA/CpsF family glycosyltransferase n=1 Tax=Uliginosibacterium sp. H1 TaxID=3114757 RepID=UPI002E193058|nr:WecB/TagA/CpsF family glycosyltransferase [Uliginosibacterium sp. H1]
MKPVDSAVADVPFTDFGRSVYCLMGLPFDAVTLSQATDAVAAAASTGKRCFLSTPNLNFLIAAQDDVKFRESVIRSDLSVVDGTPLVWMAKLLGIPLHERVAGSDVFAGLQDGTVPIKVFFFGGPDGVAERACEQLNAQGGAMRCVGYESPGFVSIDEMSSAAQIARINDSGADFVVVALGAKKGQTWIERNRVRLQAPVISHLGAVVNFVAGTVQRAPRIWQRFGVEWLWRMKEEPTLWRRYLKDGIGLLRLLLLGVVPGMLERVLSQPSADALARAQLHVRRSAGNPTTTISVGGAWKADTLKPLREVFAAVTAQPGAVVLDFAKLERVDSAFVGLVMLLHGHQSKLGHGFRISSVSPAIARQLGRMQADFLLLGTAPGIAGHFAYHQGG